MNDEATKRRIFDQVISLFISPEVARREKEGKPIKSAKLWAAQVIFRPGTRPIVRLNEEVRGRIKVKLGNGSGLAIGRTVKVGEIEGLEQFELTTADADSAHISMVRTRQGWELASDFRYNKRRFKAIVQAASQFLEAANDAFARCNWRPFILNLYTAVEFLAKAEYLLTPFGGKGTKHSFLQSRYFALSGKLGGEVRFGKLLKELAALRNPAMCDEDADFSGCPRAKQFVSIAQEMLGRTMVWPCFR